MIGQARKSISTTRQAPLHCLVTTSEDGKDVKMSRCLLPIITTANDRLSAWKQAVFALSRAVARLQGLAYHALWLTTYEIA